MKHQKILTKTLFDTRWQVFWYGIGFATMAVLIVFIYPSYREQFANFEIPEALRPLVGESNYATARGFLNAEFFSWIPLIGVIFGIMSGTSALAGEETAGTLDLLLSQPIGRTRIVLEKLGGLTLSVFLIAGITSIGWFLSVPFVSLDISYGTLVLATMRMVPLILFFLVLSMWLAAVLPDRRIATGVVSAIAFASYFGNYLASLVDGIAPIRWASVFFYFDGSNALSDAELWKTGVILATTAIFGLLAILTFEARDIGVNAGLTAPRFRIQVGTTEVRA